MKPKTNFFRQLHGKFHPSLSVWMLTTRELDQGSCLGQACAWLQDSSKDYIKVLAPTQNIAYFGAAVDM